MKGMVDGHCKGVKKFPKGCRKPAIGPGAGVGSKAEETTQEERGDVPALLWDV